MISTMVSRVRLGSSQSEQAEAKERTLSEQSSLAGSEDSFYSEAKEEIVIPKKKQANRKFRANEAASPKRIKPNPRPELRVLKKLVSRAIPSNQAPKKRPRASIEPPGPPPGAPPSKELRPKPSSLPSRRYKFERGPTVFYCDYVTNVTYKIQCKYSKL